MDTTPDADGRPVLPERAITPNMLIGYNITRWRKAAGWTQQELGEALGGWTKNAVSAAEHSWDGVKVRKFDADLLAQLALVFPLPVAAFLLPPPDDGRGVRYIIKAGDEPLTTGEFFAYADPEPDDEPETAVAVAYQQAINTAYGRYAPGQARDELAAAVADKRAAAEIEAVLESAREVGAALAGQYGLTDQLRAQNAMLQQALERALERSGQ